MSQKSYSDQKNLLDTIRWYIIVISILAIFLLIVLYILIPAYDNSAIYRLFINVAPSAIVALAVIPTAYIFLYKHGLTMEQQFDKLLDELKSTNNRLDNTSSRSSIDHHLTANPEIIEKILSSTEPSSTTTEGFDVLIAVDLQYDFIDPSGKLPVENAPKLIDPLNRVLRVAESKNIPVIFTRDWHPDKHPQFLNIPKHCLADSDGAQIHKDIYMPENRILIDFGISDLKDGFDPLENRAFSLILKSKEIKTVYIIGFALQYCVAAMCLSARRLGKRVIAIEPLIGVSEPDKDAEITKTWSKLEEKGIERYKNIPSELKLID